MWISDCGWSVQSITSKPDLANSIDEEGPQKKSQASQNLKQVTHVDGSSWNLQRHDCIVWLCARISGCGFGAETSVVCKRSTIRCRVDELVCGVGKAWHSEIGPKPVRIRFLVGGGMCFALNPNSPSKACCRGPKS